ncbi:hypothetical protein EVAR_3383_1 [Eumeta japonica]|uniref:Uncharacterized protein n=1 Tax=Eumeta variegata TaxID=151549 RepID=A0A4C1SS25_EUMVA|nr:hypothetical protein EVAR_3383_1 [Eumeta japonica]
MPEWKGRVPLTRSHCERITGVCKASAYLWLDVLESLQSLWCGSTSDGTPAEINSPKCLQNHGVTRDRWHCAGSERPSVFLPTLVRLV